MKDIVHLTHFDADALGCILHLDYATPNIPKITFSTNYRNFEEKVSETYDCCLENDTELLVISDVSFSDNVDALRKLYSLTEKGTKIIFIDHHAYTDNFFDEFPKMKIYWDISKSATKIAEEVFKTDNKNLNELSNVINQYDIWLEDTPNFDIAIAMNEYFWGVQEKINSLDRFAELIKNNDYKLPKFKTWYIDYKDKSTKYLDNLKSKKLLMSDNFFGVVFTDKYFNEVLHYEFSKGTQFMMICNSYGIIRYRTKRNSTITEEQKKEIKLKLIGTLKIGHLNEFKFKKKMINMALTAFGRIKKWNIERNLLKTPEDFDIVNETSFIIEELIEATKDIESSVARKWAKRITWLLTKIPGVKATRIMMVDAFGDIIVFCTGAIYKLGYDTDKVMKEVLKEIESRKGEVKDGKFEKFKTPEAKAKWYKADFTKCKL